MERFNNLASVSVFEMFSEISKIPRESKHEEKISTWLENWAKAHELDVIRDQANNIIIKKDGTFESKNAKTVILQAHMDMVCEKAKGSNHDFSKDPIEWQIKDDRIFANKTTLGADDGIGVAYALAVLSDKTIEHPPLEVIITTDEETGMSGALALDTSSLKGEIFINIDSEEEGLFYMSCAGGNDTTIEIPVRFESISGTVIEIEATGLLGGHSGLEIHKDRANSSKLIGRFLNDLINNQIDYNLIEVNGGSKVNVITRDTLAKIIINENDYSKIQDIALNLNDSLKVEYNPQDVDAHIELQKGEVTTLNAMTKEDTKSVVRALVLIPYGPTHYSKFIDGLVQTSSNLGVVATKENSVILASALRSSIISQKQALIDQYQVIADLVNGKCQSKSFYPAWPFNDKSKIKDIFLNSYKQLFNKDANVVAIHAGLECGIFIEKLGSHVDFISFGPDITGAHTAEESISISSIDRNWLLFVDVLKNIKNY